MSSSDDDSQQRFALGFLFALIALVVATVVGVVVFKRGIAHAPTAPKAGLRIPLALYDSVAENLLQNALAKRQQEDAVSIRVFLSDDASVLQVCDDGSPVPSEQLKDLLSAPVTSENGLGIGLYQAARQAERYGYTLRLASNVPGAVCFELRRNAPDKAADNPLS